MLEVIDHPQGAGFNRELRLARPPVNALNTELLRRLGTAIGEGAQASAILVTGQPGIFSAGLDVRGLLDVDREAVSALFIELWRTLRALAFSPVPVIFGISGHSPAGGTVLAIHGDYRVMALGDFRLGLNEVQVGLIPVPPIDAAFRRLVGGHAAQLLTRGTLMDPAAALRVGLVDELCETSQVAARALEVAREFSALPREPMLRTRALARQDLKDLYGSPEQSAARERDTAALVSEFWFLPETQARMRAQFTKK